MNKKDINSKEIDKSVFYPTDKKQEEIIRLAKQIKSKGSSYFYGALSAAAAAAAGSM